MWSSIAAVYDVLAFSFQMSVNVIHKSGINISCGHSAVHVKFTAPHSHSWHNKISFTDRRYGQFEKVIGSVDVYAYLVKFSGLRIAFWKAHPVRIVTRWMWTKVRIVVQFRLPVCHNNNTVILVLIIWQAHYGMRLENRLMKIIHLNYGHEQDAERTLRIYREGKSGQNKNT